jgi:hypothetical protein
VINTIPTTSTMDPLNNGISLEQIEYGVARTRDELEQAYTLVYNEYLKREYCQPNKSKMKLSIYNALPETTTFAAVASEKVLATATLIPNTKLGIPMSQIYSQELEIFSKQELKFCEISMLASDTNMFQRRVSMLVNSQKLFFIFFLFKLIFDYARDNLKMDIICITINPKHKLIYDLLLFKEIGGLKIYPYANNAPALARYVDLRDIEQRCKASASSGIYKMFFLNKTSPEKFKRRFLFTSDDLKYFFMDKTDVTTESTAEEINYLKDCYPNYACLKLI